MTFHGISRSQIEFLEGFAQALRELTWMDDAACADHPEPDLWFPERGGTTKAAKAICATCPVRAECLQYALDDPDVEGVWGGTSTKDRKQIRRLKNSAKYVA